MSTIELDKVSLSYSLQGQMIPILREMNLRIESGEMVAILGPSGSGKSTLLYILGCMLQATSGAFYLDGQDITKMTEPELADLRNQHFGFVFQQFHLLPRADLIQNLLLGTRYNRADVRTLAQQKQRAQELLDQMGLSSHVKHRPHQLSGGQQQRVAIARALMNDPSVILADEPTGNLDSKSAAMVLDLLRKINGQGKTVIIITHDQEVARRCDRVVSVFDGKIVEAPESLSQSAVAPSKQITGVKKISDIPPVQSRTKSRLSEDVKTAWQNLMRNKSRSLLTMLGVVIGVAAVLSTVTLGTYTKVKILQTYEDLGVNKLVIRAYPNWNQTASGATGPKYDGISQKNDVQPMRRLFSEILLFSPVVSQWVQSVQAGGKTFDKARILGVNEEYFPITNRRVSQGRLFSSYHVKNRSNVCIIGPDVVSHLFNRRPAVGQIIEINGQNEVNYACRVLGVLESQKSNNEWFDPNKQILIPDSFLAVVGDRWNSKPYEFNVKMKADASVEQLSEKVKTFLSKKYGNSVNVSVDSDEILVAQMRRFLGLFTMLLTGVALISLAVGGIGIANMMLVSVSERFKEIGLRKALGARNEEIRTQFLVESMILCGIAGLLGILFGVIGYHLMLFLASKLFTQVKFEFVLNVSSMLLSFVCIFVVGLLSGLIPALRAQKLQVVEALRSE